MTSPVGRALALLLLAAVFFRAGSAPVAMIDSWADWKYGQWVWEHHRLPHHELFSSYGDPKIEPREDAWLAEVAYYLAVSRGGLEGVALPRPAFSCWRCGGRPARWAPPSPPRR